MNILMSKPIAHYPTRKVDELIWLKALETSRLEIVPGAAFDFSVAGGWRTNRLPDRRYVTHYLFYSTDATLEIESPGNPEDRDVVAPRHLIWFAPGVPYYMNMLSNRSSNALCRLRFQTVVDGEQWTPWDRPRVVSCVSLMPRILEQLGEDWTLNDAVCESRTRALILFLACAAIRRQAEAKEKGQRLAAKQMAQLMELVQQDPAQPYTPADLAAELQLSPPYFARLFAASFHCSPRRWIVKQRLQEGARLLMDTSMTISEIADKLGYRHLHLFSRQFRDFAGVPPSEYRKVH